MRKNTLRFLAILLTFCMLPAMPVHADGEPPHAYASVLMEAETGTVLGGTDSDKPLPVGTMAKLMTVYLTARAITEGTLTADTLVTASPAAEKQQGAVIWLISGEQMSVRDLLTGVIVGNANDAAVALACRLSGSEEAFTAEMNAAASSLHMRNTHFADCTGLSDENVSTAHDLGLLCCALLQYDVLSPIFATWRTFLRDGATELVAENTLTRTYEGIRGMKAGHGTASGYTLAAAAERGGMCCVAVVLGCDDENERFSYAKQLLSNGFSGYYVTTPDFSAEFLRPLSVHHGITQAVMPEAEGLRAVAAPNGAELSCTVILPEYAEAPVTAGQPLGTAAFYCGDSLVFEVPLTAAEDVARRDFRSSAAMLLGNLFK